MQGDSHNHNIPPNHPRAKSLTIRDLLAKGFRSGLVAPEGLLAHGRGEAFDYLIGEKTSKYAFEAIRAASCLLLLARKPLISVNGNAAALCAKDLVELANLTGSLLEVNLFYGGKERENLITKVLIQNGSSKVLGIDKKESAQIPKLESNRRYVDHDGIYIADVVLVPLEDGDRTEALIRMNKKVITIDLNPLSRTAQTSNISIIDNIVRAIPELILITKKFKQMKRDSLIEILDRFNNKYNLDGSLQLIRGNV